MVAVGSGAHLGHACSGWDTHANQGGVKGVLAQRLVRKLCQSCREAYTPSSSERRQIEKFAGGVDSLYRAKGCELCRNLGFNGRIGIFELLVPDDAMAERISQGAPLTELRELAKKSGMKITMLFPVSTATGQARNSGSKRRIACAEKSGMKMLRADGIEKVKAGITTLDEVYRATA